MSEKLFSSLELKPELLAAVDELGYTQMTAIQAESLPLLLKGHDLVGQSATGSGKTAAFALHILNSLELDMRDPQALILCPTRELCAQVAREFRKLGCRMRGLQVLTLSGGQPGKPQAFALEKGAHVLVGTPGRVLDHLDRGNLHLDGLRNLVLDEADRMLDMGFEVEMSSILQVAPRMRQTIFFSATYPDTIAEMSARYQLAPSKVAIEATEVAKPLIEHVVISTEQREKVDTLLQVLKTRKPQAAIVFCNLKATVAELEEALLDRGMDVTSLHGDLEQLDRDRVLAKFRNGSTRILIATDVAARGLDIDHLDLVVNFDLPHQAETYVHRAGRTGRAGRKGYAVSLASGYETSRLMEIERSTDIRFERLQAVEQPEARVDESQAKAAMQTLYIAGGRKDKVRPGDILGALTGEAGGFTRETVGKIEIHDRFSYVAIQADLAATALERLRNGRIKGRKFQIQLVE